MILDIRGLVILTEVESTKISRAAGGCPPYHDLCFTCDAALLTSVQDKLEWSA